jgi:oligopeptide/dipeptide ABC transporter ATP-binding protein
VTSDRTAATPREPMLEMDHLRVWFPVRGGGPRHRKYVHAVDDVTLSLGEGETLGLVGESGCGKTTLARTLLRLTDPTDGSIRFRGREIGRLGHRALEPYRRQVQMVFQDPQASLNPRKRIEQILQAALRLRREDDGNPRTTVATLLQQVGLDPEFAQRYPHEFSGGQRQRIGIARALAVGPKIVILDEPVSALDVSVRAQVINLLDDLQERFGLSYVFVAHDLAVVRHISHRIAVMYLGKVVELSAADDIYSAPKHPYTAGLLQAIPIPDPDRSGRLLQAGAPKGELPSPIDPPSGCRFHSRCPYATQVCIDVEPPLTRYPDGHLAACHHPLDVTAEDLAGATRSEASPLTSSDTLPTEPAAVVGAHAVEAELEGEERHLAQDEPATR